MEPIIDDFDSIRARAREQRRTEVQESVQQQANEAVEQASSEGRLTPAQAARQTEAKRPESKDGLLTPIGEGLDYYVLEGGAVKDPFNAAVAGINALTPDDSPLKPLTH